MKQILRYFQHTDGELLFPLLDLREANLRLQYERRLMEQNKLLGVLQQRAGIPGRLTTHCSRHTWATLAKRAGIQTEVISEGLGHSDIRTTYKYLASFERSTLDTVSDKVSAIVNIPGKIA
ncbi:MAG: tyrosine-type recombinase/integrase [Bacteroides sp.]|nr:tyrosine-type recombinase/integrase [Bacteroides sp.]